VGRPIVQGAPDLVPMTQGLSNGQISVDIKGEITPEIQSFIESQGGAVIAKLPKYHAMTAKIPLAKVEALAARPEVKSIEATPPAIRNQSPRRLQDEEGDISHAAASARKTFKTTGRGIKICVVSDSVDHLDDAKANGSLTNVQILPGAQGSGEGEGTAMLEIIHRIAPGATLGFATGDGGPVVMAENIGRLADAGCKIIVDDLSYSNESPFQDGIIAQKVSEVSARGVFYFSSAANSGNKLNDQSGTWEGDFLADSTPIKLGTETGYVHVFAPGIVADRVTSVDGPHRADLFWNDPLSEPTNRYDLFVVDSQGRIVQSSTNSGPQEPHQTVEIGTDQSLLVLQNPGAQSRFLHLDTNRSRLQVGTSGSTHGHNASGAANAFTVASISASGRRQPFTAGTDVHVDIWSSDGPRRMFFTPNGTELTLGNLSHTGGQLVQKPDITAADCVTTDVPGFAPFCGTSAAAPQAAAIAALVISYRPTLTSAQIRTILTSTSLDIETPGWDNASGFGIVMPGPALAAAKAAADHKIAGGMLGRRRSTAN
jgi:subtilisin family serine protease